MLAFDGAGFAVDAVDDSGVSVDVDGHAFVEEVVGFWSGAPTHFMYSDLFMIEP